MKNKERPLYVQLAFLAVVFGMLGSILAMTMMAWQTEPTPTPKPKKVVWVLKHHCPGGDCEKSCREDMKPEHADSDWVEGPCPAAPPPTPIVQHTATSVPTEEPTQIPTLPPPTSVPTEEPTRQLPTATGVPPVVPINPTPTATSIFVPPPPVATSAIFTVPESIDLPSYIITPTATIEVCDLCEAQEAKLLSEARWYNTLSDFVQGLMGDGLPYFWEYAFRDR